MVPGQRNPGTRRPVLHPFDEVGVELVEETTTVALTYPIRRNPLTTGDTPVFGYAAPISFLTDRAGILFADSYPTHAGRLQPRGIY